MVSWLFLHLFVTPVCPPSLPFHFHFQFIYLFSRIFCYFIKKKIHTSFLQQKWYSSNFPLRICTAMNLQTSETPHLTSACDAVDGIIKHWTGIRSAAGVVHLLTGIGLALNSLPFLNTHVPLRCFMSAPGSLEIQLKAQERQPDSLLVIWKVHRKHVGPSAPLSSLSLFNSSGLMFPVRGSQVCVNTRLRCPARPQASIFHKRG